VLLAVRGTRGELDGARRQVEQRTAHARLFRAHLIRVGLERRDLRAVEQRNRGRVEHVEDVERRAAAGARSGRTAEVARQLRVVDVVDELTQLAQVAV